MAQRGPGDRGDGENWEPEQAGGWDQAKDSAQTPSDLKLNPQRVRLWRRMRWLTFVCATMQCVPAIVWVTIPPWDNAALFWHLAVSMVIASALVLAPYLAVNTISLVYPFWFMAIWTVIRHGGNLDLNRWVGDTCRYGLAFYTDTHEWELWPLRVAMAAAMIHLLIKMRQLWKVTPADRDAIRFWWRRPVDDVLPQSW